MEAAAVPAIPTQPATPAARRFHPTTLPGPKTIATGEAATPLSLLHHPHRIQPRKRALSNTAHEQRTSRFTPPRPRPWTSAGSSELADGDRLRASKFLVREATAARAPLHAGPQHQPASKLPMRLIRMAWSRRAPQIRTRPACH